MNTFFLFTFDEYYPSGGMNDLRGSFASIEDARAEKNKSDYEYFQIVQFQDGKLVILEGYGA